MYLVTFFNNRGVVVMPKYQGKSDGTQTGGKVKKRGWGGRLKPAELRRELCSGNPATQRELISAEEEARLRERLALLHQEYFQMKEIPFISLSKIGIESVSALRTAFKNYDAALAKANRRIFAATTGPLAVLLGIK